ncbi:hypothetical protein PTKIN_Ptkin13bG0260800 [Pterospermum kingtungense]
MAYETAAAMHGESLRKGSWHEEEDETLTYFVELLGSRRWDYVARVSGLKRSGKSCRLRWLNYLRPNIKHGHITAEEETIILQLHQRWGNKWSMIARRLPGRTDNEIKNYWRTHLRKKAHIPPEQENFQFGRDNGKLTSSSDGSSTQTYIGESYKPCGNILENENSSHDAVVLSDYSLTSSPYETRLSDWISEFPSDQSEVKSQEDSNTNSTDSCYCYPEWISEENDLWGSSGSLWNME